MIEKTCKKCFQTKEVSKFRIKQTIAGVTRYNSLCKECLCKPKPHSVPLPDSLFFCKKCNKIKGIEDFISNSKNYCRGCFNESNQKGRRVPPIITSRVCTTCNNDLPLYDFEERYKKGVNRSLNTKNKYLSKCKSCRRLRFYNIDYLEFKELLIKQNNKCYICGKPGEQERHKKLSIDHCHKTDKVRKLLCTHCNTALGVLRDDLVYFKKLESYIIEHKINNH